MACQLSFCRRSSFGIYPFCFQGCRFSGFFFLRKEKKLSLFVVKGYRSTLTSVFKYKIPEICDNLFLWDLICSFEIERPLKTIRPPSWVLVKVLEHFWGPVFKPLASKPLKIVTIKTLFLLSLATAKRVRELQALSCRVAFRSPDVSLSYLLSLWLRPSRRGILFHAPSWLSPCWNLWGISLMRGCCVMSGVSEHISTPPLLYLHVPGLCLCHLSVHHIPF